MKYEKNTVSNFTPVPLDAYKCEWDPLQFLVDEDEELFEADLVEIDKICLGTTCILLGAGMSPSQPEMSSRGMEVGDDRVDVARSPLPLARALCVQERVLKMKTSSRDTFISNTYWNFCEVTNKVPAGPDESFDLARKIGDFKNLGFTDSPQLRIIIDCSKGDNSHSSTANGKASMLGSRLSTPRTEMKPTLMLASWLQDSCLNTNRSTDPKYLPRILGGSGVRALYDNPRNILLYSRSYRGGGYDRLYGSAIREVMECLSQLERGKPTSPLLCYKLRDRQEYLYGTYANIVLVPPDLREFSKEMPDPLYKRVGTENRFQAFESRLIRSRHVVGRLDAEREWERTSRVREILRTELTSLESESRAKERSKARRSNFEMSLNANAQFKRLLDRRGSLLDVQHLIGEGFHPVTTGVLHFTLADAMWVFQGCKSENFTSEDLLRNEDIYVRSEVSMDESFRVGGIDLYPTVSGNASYQRTSTSVGLYQINGSMLEWSEELLQRLIDLRERVGRPSPADLLHEFNKNREWVNDDTSLIGQCIEDTKNLSQVSSVVLISDDRRLANQMCNSANITVHRVPVLWAISRMPKSTYDSQTAWTVSEVMAFRKDVYQLSLGAAPAFVYTDTGSLMATAAKLQEVTLPERTKVYIRELDGFGFSDQNRRLVSYRLKPVENKYLQVETRTPIYKPMKIREVRPTSSVHRSGSFSSR